MNLLDTIQGSLLEKFFPEGWDLARIDQCCSLPPEEITHRQAILEPAFPTNPL